MAPEVLIAVVGVFVAMCVVVGTTTSWVLARNSPERRRIRAIAQPVVGTGRVAADDRLIETPDPILATLSRLVPKSPKEMTKLQRTLTRAGYPSGRDVVIYSVAEVVLPLV